MMQRSLKGTLAGFVVLGGLFLEPPPNLTGYPNSMASLGDSITRAFNTGGVPLTDAPGNSWSTGTRTSVQSHYVRILAADPAILERNFNDAKSGAKMVDLDPQVSTATEQNVAYITILIGANDLCTRTVAGMTSIADFPLPVRTGDEHPLSRLSSRAHLRREHPQRIPAVGHP
jgi:lysophospholipase L1-like esterase